LLLQRTVIKLSSGTERLAGRAGKKMNDMLLLTQMGGVVRLSELNIGRIGLTWKITKMAFSS